MFNALFLITYFVYFLDFH